MKATRWLVKHKDCWVFNHLEDGHSASDTPTQKTKEQAGWARMTWKREHVWLSDDVPPKVSQHPWPPYVTDLSGREICTDFLQDFKDPAIREYLLNSLRRSCSPEDITGVLVPVPGSDKGAQQ